MNTNQLAKVNHAALKTNQAVIIILNITAFIFNAPWLAAIVSLAMFLGTLLKTSGFKPVYKILETAGILKPHIILDNPEPHRFAQGFGGTVMLIGTLGLYTGVTTLGWGLVWLVAGLAALNLFGGFCVGCAVYYWLGRLHVPGFTKSPPEGIFPGMRPTTKASHDR